MIELLAYIQIFIHWPVVVFKNVYEEKNNEKSDLTNYIFKDQLKCI